MIKFLENPMTLLCLAIILGTSFIKEKSIFMQLILGIATLISVYFVSRKHHSKK